MDKRQQHSLRYLPDFTQQYFSSILVAYNVAEGMLISKCLKLRNVPFHLILNGHVSGLILTKQQCNCQARRPSKLYFVKILLIDRFYSHVFEIFVSETEVITH